MFKNIMTSIQAEGLKLRFSGLLIITLIFSLLAPLILLLPFTFDPNFVPEMGYPYFYFSKILESIIPVFTSLILPLFIVIVAVRIFQIDHKNNAWRLMETQPMLKISIYSAKFFWLMVVIALCTAFTLAFGILEFWIISWFADIPDIASMKMEWGKIIATLFRITICSLSFASLMFLIALVFRNSIVSAGLGFALLMFKFVLFAFFQIPLRAFPLSILTKITSIESPSDMGRFMTYDAYLGIFMALIILSLGYLYYHHRNFYYAFVKNKGRGLASLLALGLSTVLLYFLFQPSEMQAFQKTVVLGTLDSEEPIHNIKILDPFQNTIIQSKVEKGNFRLEINEELPLDYYILVINEQDALPLIMSTNDSIYIDFHYKNLTQKTKISGSRLAENLYPTRNTDILFRISTSNNKKILEDPEKFLEKLKSSYEKQLKSLRKYSTADNYTLREDFREKKTKLINIAYLNEWSEYVEQRNAELNTSTLDNDFIEKLKKSLESYDISLLSDASYTEYLKNQLLTKKNDTLSEDLQLIQKLGEIKDPKFRSRALGLQLSQYMDMESDSIQRNAILNRYLPLIENPSVRHRLADKNKSISSNGISGLAPDFEAVNLAGKPENLSSLQGRFVVVDIWATWCKPCLNEAPFFEKVAHDFNRNQTVVFLSLSVDEDINAWKNMVGAKESPCLQWHVNDLQAFADAYGLEEIPRYLLIDKEGQLINNSLPMPSHYSFAQELEKYFSKEFEFYGD